MTVHQKYIALYNSLLKIYSTQEAKNIAELVILDVLNENKIDKFFWLTQKFSIQSENLLNEITDRLLNFEPVQYVLQKAWFYEYQFHINKNTLIPRPETEELVFEVITYLKKSKSTLNIIDIGTGSGCIAISLKKQMPMHQIYALDICEKALAIAKINEQNLQVKINFIEADILNIHHFSSLPKVDCIVSNPPYIPLNEKNNLSKNVINFEPHLALFTPENEALIFYSSILKFAQLNLALNGMLFLETHENFANQVLNLFNQNNFETIVKKDMQQKLRIIIAKKTH